MDDYNYSNDNDFIDVPRKTYRGECPLLIGDT